MTFVRSLFLLRMAHNFTLTYPRTFTHELKNTFRMLSQRVPENSASYA